MPKSARDLAGMLRRLYTTACEPTPHAAPAAEAIDSIELPGAPSPFGFWGLRGLLAAPWASLMLCYCFREGRDLTWPLTIASNIVLFLGIGLVVMCWSRKDDERFRGGILAGLFALFVCGCGFPASYVSVTKEYAFSVTAKDELNGQPIPNAAVTITSYRFPSPKAVTDRKGNCKIKCELSVREKHSIVCCSGDADLQAALITIEANGFLPFEASLGDLIGPAWPRDGPPLPPIEIALQPVR